VYAHHAQFDENRVYRLQKIKLRQSESTLKKAKNRSTFPISTTEAYDFLSFFMMSNSNHFLPSPSDNHRAGP
jgi:hypothetical protein